MNLVLMKRNSVYEIPTSDDEEADPAITGVGCMAERDILFAPNDSKKTYKDVRTSHLQVFKVFEPGIPIAAMACTTRAGKSYCQGFR